MKRFVRRKNVDVGLTRTSVGTTSRSRKNSERSRAISAKEFWNRWEKMLAIWRKHFVNTHLDLPILSERIAEEELTSVVPGSMVRATNFPAEQKTFRSWNICLKTRDRQALVRSLNDWQIDHLCTGMNVNDVRTGRSLQDDDISGEVFPFPNNLCWLRFPVLGLQWTAFIPEDISTPK